MKDFLFSDGGGSYRNRSSQIANSVPKSGDTANEFSEMIQCR